MRPVCDNGADSASGGEQGRGLAFDDLQIVGDARFGPADGRKLAHLALGNRRGGIGEDPEHLQRPDIDHELERAAEQEIPDQYARLVSPEGVGGFRPPPQQALIDDIVVQQRGRMDELDAGRELDMLLPLVAAEARRRQCEHRTQPLAAGDDDVARQLGNQRDLVLHPFEDQRIDARHVRADKRLQRGQRLRRRRGCRRY